MDTDSIHSAPTRRIRLPGPEGIHLHVRLGPENGPPVLLLHGHPENHLMWHKVWPQLARCYTLVAPDLRGYGDSDKPAGAPDHSNYSKRTMAADVVALMEVLGHDRFHVVAHDRGARVAHRLGMDHPQRARTLTLMDIAPTLAMYRQTSEAFARAYWHWFFLIQPAPLPETLMANHGAQYVRELIGGRHAGLAPFPPQIMSAYERCASDPGTIHGICEDYRASATIDLEHEQADRDAGRMLEMPTLVLWGRHGAVARCFDVEAEWKQVAHQPELALVDCGHYPPEEDPQAVCQHLLDFLSRHPAQAA